MNMNPIFQLAPSGNQNQLRFLVADFLTYTFAAFLAIYFGLCNICGGTE